MAVLPARAHAGQRLPSSGSTGGWATCGGGTMEPRDTAAVARRIVDANLYMVLATADATGRPWASPVYFANSGYDEFFWVSSPDATHSRNIAARPQVGIVVFDSQVPIGTGQGVYMAAVAEQVSG